MDLENQIMSDQIHSSIHQYQSHEFNQAELIKQILMSCVLIETGQCGNQLGYILLDKLFNQFSNSSSTNSSTNMANDIDINEKQREVFFRQSGNKSK